jgi:hypothetical protein
MIFVAEKPYFMPMRLRCQMPVFRRQRLILVGFNYFAEKNSHLIYNKSINGNNMANAGPVKSDG